MTTTVPQKINGVSVVVGSENTDADALSRRHNTPYTQFQAAILAGIYDFLDELRKENMDCADLKVLQQ